MKKVSKRIASTSALFPEENDTPIEAIRRAIIEADYQTKGAPYEPFDMKFAQESDFTNIWSSERGDEPIKFYSFTGKRSDGFLPLGDFAITGGVPFGQTPIMLLKPDARHPGALAHPVDFQWILDDAGSGNSRDLSYWWPIAPDPVPGGPSYQAVGICVTNAEKPDPKNYWVVSTDYLQFAQVAHYWSDADQSWKHHNGDLGFPVVTGGQSSEEMVIAPTTMLSYEFTSDNDGNANASCLVVKKLFLPVPGATEPGPIYSDESGAGSSTRNGIVKVAVLPSNVIVDSNRSATASNAPFYYLAGLPHWDCQRAFSSDDGGSYTHTYMIGTSTVDSKAFQETNSITVSADVGAESGSAGGPQMHLSVSYTHEMQITTSSSVSHDTQTTDSLTLTLPKARRVLIWQKSVEFVTYRAQTVNGAVVVSPLSDVRYQSAEVKFTRSPD